MRKIIIKCCDCDKRLGKLEQIDSARIFIDFAICDKCDTERRIHMEDCEE